MVKSVFGRYCEPRHAGEAKTQHGDGVNKEPGTLAPAPRRQTGYPNQHHPRHTERRQRTGHGHTTARKHLHVARQAGTTTCGNRSAPVHRNGLARTGEPERAPIGQRPVGSHAYLITVCAVRLPKDFSARLSGLRSCAGSIYAVSAGGRNAILAYPAANRCFCSTTRLAAVCGDDFRRGFAHCRRGLRTFRAYRSEATGSRRTPGVRAEVVRRRPTCLGSSRGDAPIVGPRIPNELCRDARRRGGTHLRFCGPRGGSRPALAERRGSLFSVPRQSG
jgi:hypothetical protein